MDTYGHNAVTRRQEDSSWQALPQQPRPAAVPPPRRRAPRPTSTPSRAAPTPRPPPSTSSPRPAPGSSRPPPSTAPTSGTPRPTSGYGDPRITRTGPGPGAGTEQEPERSSKLSARLALALTVVIGQLWGLTIVVDEWMAGDTGTAWWGAGFLVLSFLVVLGLWAIDPKDR